MGAGELKSLNVLPTLLQGRQLNHNKLTARTSEFIPSKKGIFLVHTAFRPNLGPPGNTRLRPRQERSGG